MRKSSISIIIILALLLLSHPGVQAQTLSAPAHLRIGTQDLGSAHYVYGAIFAKIWRGVLPKGSTIDVLPYAGGVGNALLIDKGDADLGLLFGAAAKWATDGKVVFDKKITVLTGLVGGLDHYYVGVMATKRSGITSLEEVARKKMPVRIVTQPTGGASEASTRLVLEAYGMSYEAIRSWGGAVTPTATGVVQAQMQDGKADVWINMVVAGHPAISELAMSTDLVFLPMSDAIIKKLEPYGYKKTFLPAKSFKGQDKDVPLVGWPTILVAHKDVKPEVAYILTKSIVENKAELVKGHSGLKDFMPEDAWKMTGFGIALHPGAEKYYRDKGMMK